MATGDTAISFSTGSSEWAEISSDVLSIESDYTICGFWFATISHNGVIIHLGVAGANHMDALQILNGQLQVLAYNGSDLIVDNGSTSFDGAWGHVCLRRTGDTLDAFLDGVNQVTGTVATGVRAATDTMRFASHVDGSGGGDGRASGWKAWTRALTTAEIIMEAEQSAPLSCEDLYAIWPLKGGPDRAKDLSGNARDWTENNTPTDSEGPSIPHSTGSLLVIPPGAVAAPGATATGAATGLLASAAVVGTQTHTSTAAATGLPATAAVVGTQEQTATAAATGLIATAVCVGTQTHTSTAAATGLLGIAAGTASHGNNAVAAAVGLPATASGVGGQAHSATVTAIGLLGTVAGVGGQAHSATVTAIGLLGVGSGSASQATSAEATGAAIGLLGVGASIGTQTIDAVASGVGLLGVGAAISHQYQGPTVTTGTFTPSVSLSEGDEYYVVIDGPSTAAPSARVQVTFRATP